MEGGSIYLPGVGENTELVMTTDICNCQLQQACGHGSMSEAACLPIISAYVLEENNKAIEWKRKHRI
jgi:hypothetical protein